MIGEPRKIGVAKSSAATRESALTLIDANN